MREGRFVHALTLELGVEWRRLPPAERRRSAEELVAACRSGGVTTLIYTSVGLQPGADVLLWSLGSSVEALEERAAAMLRSGLGTWATVGESLLGQLGQSPYVRRPSAPTLFMGPRARYLVLYPFTKSTDWYLLGPEVRQAVMNEHIRVGRRFPQVRQLLASSFGIDDQDHLVAYEMDDLTVFSDLVRELRSTRGRLATVRDTPVLVALRRPPEQIATLLAA
jgi:chlorite dismutase